ncbi:MAG: UvrD-helicase domain-containing protein, partial [Solirubrobacterales bacterium]
MSRPSPTPEQRAAVETRDRHVLLEAGAGTGKTSALVDRFCASVLDDEVPVGRICAFTFTDRAAGEMRDRIRIRLRSLANEAQASEDHERAAELRTHVRAMEGAWISSIHGFCRRLLSSHPVAAGLDPRFRVLDPSEADRLAARAFEQALQDAVDTHGDDAVQLAAAFRVEGLQAMVRSAYSELRSRGERHPRLPEPSASDPGPCLANLASSAREALAEITELSNTAAEGWRGCIRRSIAIAERADGPEGLEMAELDGCVVTSKAKTFQGMAAQGWKDALDATIRCVAEATHEGRYRALQALVAAYSERYEEAKGRRGALDFEDLQLDAVGLLRTVPSVATRWQERFDHLLVDEFQDTNELQLSLIEQLAGPATRRFVVGDEFQSIYGFRNADIEVFRSQRRRAEAAEDWTKLALRGNFRSHPDILAVVNALGTASLDGFAPLTAGREPTEPAPGPTGPRVEMLVTDLAGWRDEDVRDAAGSDLDAPATRIAEARALAERLRELHDEGVPRQDMVVLLRAFAGSVDAYEDALERYGLDPYVVGGRGYWSHQQVTDTLNLLGVVANPLDDKALAGTLASPAVSVTPDTLWLLRRAAGSAPLWEMIDRWVAPDADGESAAPVAAEALAPGDGSAPQLSLDLPAAGGDGPGIDADADRRREQQRWTGEILDADRERLVTFAARLRDLRARAATLSLERLVDETVSAFDYDLALLSKAAGARRMANVRKLGRLAREYEEHEGHDLRGFLDEAAERTERDVEGEAATQAENHDGVRILTVHAAKGLEFAVVAVAELGRGLLSGGSPPALRFGTPAAGSSAPRVGVKMARLGRDGIALYDFEPLSDEAKEMESAEERRLAYVAATRAEQRLLLSGTAKLEPDIAIEPRTPIMARLAVALDVALSDPPATVQAPAPAPREGIEAEFASATVAIRVNRASADRAHELAAGAPTFLDEDGGGPEPEPIPLPPAERLAAQAAGSPAPSTLSPSALA